MASLVPCRTCGGSISSEATLCPHCGQPQPVSEHAVSAVAIKVGTIYEGRVRSITPFGAFVEIAPGVEGLLHISELDHRRVGKVEDLLSVGEVVQVKVLEVDERGRMKLSRKALLS